jgi:histidine ammonia-lyase
LAANEDGTDSGLMIVQYTAAALVNKLATRSHAAATHSIPTSANTEDHVSMGANEALDLWEMCGDLGRVLAIELWVATQALEQRQLILSCAYAAANQLGVQALRSKVRNVSPVRPEDAMRLAEDIKRLQQELRRLKDIGPARPAARVLALVRGAGVAYLDRDRALHPELEILQRLVRERVLIRAIEDELGLTLELG